MNRPWVIPVAIAVVVLICLCCLCVAASGFASFMLIRTQSTTISEDVYLPDATPDRVRPGTPSSGDSPVETPAPMRTPDGNGQQGPEPQVTSSPVNSAALEETIRTLGDTSIPLNDAADLARRLQGKVNIPLTLEPPETFPEVGDKKTFWVSNTDTNENFMVDTTLRYVTDHAYFWIENNVSYRERELRR